MFCHSSSELYSMSTFECRSTALRPSHMSAFLYRRLNHGAPPCAFRSVARVCSASRSADDVGLKPSVAISAASTEALGPRVMLFGDVVRLHDFAVMIVSIYGQLCWLWLVVLACSSPNRRQCMTKQSSLRVLDGFGDVGLFM